MMKKLLILIAILLLAGAILSFVVTRDGSVENTDRRGKQSSWMPARLRPFRSPIMRPPSFPMSISAISSRSNPASKIHVLEVGSGYPVYLQHGNPTSGFLYRRVAEELPRDQFRLIMPTMVGLGFSSKVPASEHTLENHMRWMTAALEQLQLEEAIYVGQDWGGPVGMGVMARSPELLRGVVAMNTGFTAPVEQRDLSTAHATVKTPVVGELMLETFGSIFDRLPGAQGDPESMPADVLDLYGRPVP